MGEVRKESGIPPKPFEPNPQIEAALERLKRAIGKAG
jgi:16S rRNA A1518/A1519 N6-dimethyltransferase RsmA/KsgA/DIM1 with predicted DNA glycosylase/AP lyase activity